LFSRAAGSGGVVRSGGCPDGQLTPGPLVGLIVTECIAGLESGAENRFPRSPAGAQHEGRSGNPGELQYAVPPFGVARWSVVRTASALETSRSEPSGPVPMATKCATIRPRRAVEGWEGAASPRRALKRGFAGRPVVCVLIGPTLQLLGMSAPS
jgi:hypothetical protein